MISFAATEEEQAFVDMAKTLAKEKFRPAARRAESEGVLEPDLIRKVEELGFLSMELPEHWNGFGLSLLSQVQIVKALSYGDPGILQGLPGTGDAASLIRVLPDDKPVNRLKKLYGQFSEPIMAYFDLMAMEDGRFHLEKVEGGYRVTGTTCPARLAAKSQIAVLAARDQEGEPVVFFLQTDGLRMVSGDNLGLQYAGIGQFHFNGYFIPSEQVLSVGREAEDFIRKARVRIYILEGAKQSGVAEAALDYATAYTAMRKAFGQEIARFQGVSFRVADMAIQSRSAWLLVLQAAEAADRGDKEAEGFALRALSKAHGAALFNTNSCVQLLGGHGFIREYPAEKWMRDARTESLLYGRERELLHHWGLFLLEGEKEVKTVDLL